MLSGNCSGQADGSNIAHGADRLQGHIAGALCGPLVGLLKEQGTDEPDNGGLVGKDVDDVGAALNLPVEA